MAANEKLDHATAREWMTEHIDQLLDSARAEQLMVYLDQHTDLKAELAELKSTVKLVNELDVVEPPSDFAASVIDRLPRKRKSFVIPFSNPAVQFLAAAAMLAVVVRYGFEMKRPERAAPATAAQDVATGIAEESETEAASAEPGAATERLQKLADESPAPVALEAAVETDLEGDLEEDMDDVDVTAARRMIRPAPAPHQDAPKTVAPAERDGRIWAGGDKAASAADAEPASDPDISAAAGFSVHSPRSEPAPEEVAGPRRSLASQYRKKSDVAGAKAGELTIEPGKELRQWDDAVEELESPDAAVTTMKQRVERKDAAFAETSRLSRKTKGRSAVAREVGEKPADTATLSSVGGRADRVRLIGVVIQHDRETELRDLLARYDVGRETNEVRKGEEARRGGRHEKEQKESRMTIRRDRFPEFVEALRKIGAVDTIRMKPIADRGAEHGWTGEHDRGLFVFVEIKIEYADLPTTGPGSTRD